MGRFVAVHNDVRQLKWCHPPGPANAKDKSLALDSVIGICYGKASRCAVLFPNASPWLCFSLQTVDRSFDFICQDESAIQNFMLTLSRHCARAHGAIKSRSCFLALKGWCKVQSFCDKRSISPACALKQAIRAVGKEMPVAPVLGSLQAVSSVTTSEARSTASSVEGAKEASTLQITGNLAARGTEHFNPF